MQNSDFLDWQTESLRLTAFLSSPAQIPEQDWWKDLTGDVPDRKSFEPKTGLRQEEGRFRIGKIDSTLVLAIQPSRIDWQLAPSLDNFEISGIPVIGSFSDLLDSFSDLMTPWLSTAPAVQRLAFGAVLNKPVDSAKEGYQSVSSYLPSVTLDEDASDFFYQINRPRKSTSTAVSDLSINRLSKWNVGLFAGFAMDPSNPNQLITRPPSFFVRLELDINTAQTSSPDLPAEHLPQVFGELLNLGREIASKGDIK